VVLVQHVQVPHNKPVVRNWTNYVERRIAREITTQGHIIGEALISEAVIESCDFDEETLECDTDREEEEIISEDFERGE
jgi:hypothetical protein